MIFFGDHRGRGQGQGDVFRARRHSLPAALHGIDTASRLVMLPSRTRVLRQRLDGITLDPRIFPARIGELHQLHRGRRDIHPEQRRRFRLEISKFKFSCNRDFPFRMAG